MQSIGNYLISIAAAALICAMSTALIGHKQPQGAIVKLIAGIILSLCVLSPILDVRLDDLSTYLDGIQTDAHSVTDAAANAAKEQLKQIIKQNTEAYILDKANSMGLTLSVTVTVSDEDPPLPVQVVIVGQVSSYNKKRLCNIINNDLGIPEVAQKWN